MRDSAWGQHFGYPARPIWSFDNDKIHQNKNIWQALQINSRNRYPLPPNSPDMHKVVEHCVAILKDRFQAWLYSSPTPLSMAAYQRHLKRIFEEHITAASVAADVATLPDTYHAILHPTVNGGQPPQRYR